MALCEKQRGCGIKLMIRTAFQVGICTCACLLATDQKGCVEYEFYAGLEVFFLHFQTRQYEIRNKGTKHITKEAK